MNKKHLIKDCTTCENKKFLNDAGSGVNLDCYGCENYSKWELKRDNGDKV